MQYICESFAFAFPFIVSFPALLSAFVLLVGLCACGGGSDDSAPSERALSAAAALGEKIFSDAALSASGRLSCAGCHDPAAAHGPANPLAAQFGGAALDRQGRRKAPSLRYLAANRPFGFDAEGTPNGGFFWDGRGASLAEQAGEPLLNPDEMANAADPAYFDLGSCARAELCGAFRVPFLRNVAERRAFFHNGRFKTLEETLAFYVQRDTNPERWYPPDANGEPRKFDDLPAAYAANVNTSEAPYDRRRGEAPALSDAEIDDLIAFLKTLSDRPTTR